MNCKYCRYDSICGGKEYWEKRGFCDVFWPVEWGVAKRIYEKELQKAGNE